MVTQLAWQRYVGQIMRHLTVGSSQESIFSTTQNLQGRLTIGKRVH